MNGDDDMSLDAESSIDVATVENTHTGAPPVIEDSTIQAGTNLHGIKAPVKLPGMGLREPAMVKVRSYSSIEQGQGKITEVNRARSM